jgi:hypothetical protein
MADVSSTFGASYLNDVQKGKPLPRRLSINADEISHMGT